MLFTEARFILFFAVAFSITWLLRWNSLRKTWLLLCSYAFYAAWDWRFLSLILTSTVIDFISGGMLGRKEPPGGRRLWLLLSLICNLSLLGVFKYFHFFVDPALSLLSYLGLPVSAVSLQIILPVGISFYTFQTLSYTIDIYFGKLKPIRNPLDFSLFVGFFPQLVAGPIVRASEFLPQLTRKPFFADIPFRSVLTLFLIGYIKKACVADQIAAYVDPIYANPELFGPFVIWQGLLLYAVQVYCDFSGYSDMAIATAGLLGYKLPLNFNFPLLSGSLSEFWQRWHLTLSRWFRDFLYIPMGGNRLGALRTYLNLGTVFLLCGIWHGGAWRYAVWGLLHGLFLIMEKLTGIGQDSKARGPLRFLYFNFVLSLTWPIFRTENFSKAGDLYMGMFGFGLAPSNFDRISLVWLVVLVGFYLVHFAAFRKIFSRPLDALPDWQYSILYGVGWALALLFAAAQYQPFIYFQF